MTKEQLAAGLGKILSHDSNVKMLLNVDKYRGRFPHIERKLALLDAAREIPPVLNPEDYGGDLAETERAQIVSEAVSDVCSDALLERLNSSMEMVWVLYGNAKVTCGRSSLGYNNLLFVWPTPMAKVGVFLASKSGNDWVTNFCTYIDDNGTVVCLDDNSLLESNFGKVLGGHRKFTGHDGCNLSEVHDLFPIEYQLWPLDKMVNAITWSHQKPAGHLPPLWGKGGRYHEE